MIDKPTDKPADKQEVMMGFSFDRAVRILHKNLQIERVGAILRERDRFVPPSQQRVLKKLNKYKVLRNAKKLSKRGGRILSPIFDLRENSMNKRKY